MFSTIVVRVDDLAIFLKENAKDLFYDNHHFSVLALVNKWNDAVKEISSYGFFFDGESKDFDYHERYVMPSTSVAIKAVKLMFEANESENIFYIDRKFFGTWINDFINKYAISTSNSIVKRRHGTIERAKDSLIPRCL